MVDGLGMFLGCGKGRLLSQGSDRGLSLLLTTTGRDYCSCGCQFSAPGWAREGGLREEEFLGGVGL